MDNTQNIITLSEIEDAIESLTDILNDDPHDEDAHAELETLIEVRESMEEADACTAIHEDYMETYAREFAEKIGAIEDASRWPVYLINWSNAADDLRADFYLIDYAGQTYYAH